jgi:hypothetical protein
MWEEIEDACGGDLATKIESPTFIIRRVADIPDRCAYGGMGTSFLISNLPFFILPS